MGRVFIMVAVRVVFCGFFLARILACKNFGNAVANVTYLLLPFQNKKSELKVKGER